MKIERFEYTKEGLEEEFDINKAVLLEQLVRDKLIKEDVANNWCATHTIVLKKKPFFRTISELFKKEKECEKGYYSIVVKADVFVEEEKKDGKK